jgi:hypothetical protein
VTPCRGFLSIRSHDATAIPTEAAKITVQGSSIALRFCESLSLKADTMTQDSLTRMF